MKHLGNITQIHGSDVPIVDIVTGGSPCQDLSVAGKRAGLAGERSGLFMEQIRIVKEMRDESVRQIRMRGSDEPIRPRYMVWENVPGAFSSNKGADFQAVLEETAKVAKGDASIPGPPGGKWPSAGAIMGNGWSIAWRVHDAQFWGVPQRRKRISLVADFGGATAPEILFERKGLSGDSEESGIQGQEAAASVGNGTQEASSYTLKMRGGREIDSKGHKAGKGPLVQTELSGTLGVSQDQTLITKCLNPMVMEGINGQIAGTLDASYYRGCGERQGIEREVVCVGNGQLAQARISDKVGALNCMHDQQAVMVTQTYQNIAGTLDCCIAKGTSNQLANNDMFIANTFVVRRLTPTECERLQGFPDGWTDIGEWTDTKGKKHKDADSPRYKALGNSIALPFWQWMAVRMVQNLPFPSTMASLFDGIGGFPLVFSRCGCKPVWASEIEEFPIAVTKMRFPSV